MADADLLRTALDAARLVQKGTESSKDETWQKLNLLAHAVVEMGAIVDVRLRVPADPDLAHLCEAWPRVPAKIKAAIIALVENTKRETK